MLDSQVYTVMVDGGVHCDLGGNMYDNGVHGGLMLGRSSVHSGGGRTVCTAIYDENKKCV